MKLGKMVLAYREKNKQSGKDLAKEIGVQYDALLRFEQGKPVHLKHWMSILRWMLTA